MHPQQQIIQTTTRLFHHADHHRWDDLLGVFADEVELDYTSLTGGDPVRVTPEEVVAAWRPGFEAIDAHQHLVSNHLVDLHGSSATVTATFIATHQHDGETWTLGGDYTFSLTDPNEVGDWRITAMTMTATWQTGVLDLMAKALA